MGFSLNSMYQFILKVFFHLLKVFAFQPGESTRTSLKRTPCVCQAAIHLHENFHDINMAIITEM